MKQNKKLHKKGKQNGSNMLKDVIQNTLKIMLDLIPHLSPVDIL